MITIYPVVATINAAEKPYTASFYADANFIPSMSIWTINGRPRYVTTEYTPTGGLYRVQGPSYVFSDAACVVEISMLHQIGGAMETVTYTTDEQRDPAALAITLVQQKDGVEITDGSTVPSTPIVSGIAGANQINLTWSRTASGHLSSSRVWARVVASDYTGFINRITVNWGDGFTDTHDYDSSRDVILDTTHEYVGTTGSKVVTAYHTTAGGQTPGPTGTLNVTVSTDAADWYTQQYEITRYRTQPGFMQVRPVGWRDIEAGDRDVEMYDVNKANTYYSLLRLRELDYTGRPIRTSAYSAVASVGPWA